MPYDAAVPTLQSPWAGRLSFAALFLLAVAAGAYVIFPFRTGQVGYDSAASVLYFDRLIAGQHLESAVAATPKPLLTLIYGATYAIVPDWRVISWMAIAAFGVCVVLATELARRIGGPLAAGFAAIGFLVSATLLRDVALAYALVWALLGWLVAGLALTASPARFGVAGVGLLVAGTARFESLVLSGLAVVAVAIWWGLARLGRLPPPPRAAWLLGIGLLALPIQLGHDWLLTGDAWFSQTIAPRATDEAQIIGPINRARWLIERYLAYGATLGLAFIGIGLLAVKRRIDILLGLAALGLGVAAFLVLLEARHIYVSTRYAGAIDLALLFTAAVGFGGLAVPLFSRAVDRIPEHRRGAAAVVAGGVAGILVGAQLAALSPDVIGVARSNLTLHSNAVAALPSLAAELDRIDGVRVIPEARPGAEAQSPTSPALLVPLLLRPQLAIDLDLPLTAIDGLAANEVPPNGSGLRPGQIAFHDRRGDGPDPAFDILETDVPVVVGDIRLVPVSSDPIRGWWVARVEAAGD